MKLVHARRQAGPGRLLLAAAAGLGLARCASYPAGLAPLQWVKVDGSLPAGEVLGPGSPGAFDEMGNFTVRAFRDGDAIALYYGGLDGTAPPSCPGVNGSHWRVGLARAADGVSFTRVQGSETGGSILDLGASGNFDDSLTYRPFVLKDGSVYRMWYNGSRSFFNCPKGTLAVDRRVGYAESTDGVSWTRSYDGAGPGGSVLPLGAPGAIDAQQVGYVWVLEDGAEYRMYYSANDATNTWRVALAVSSDAHNWTKVPGKQSGGSVLDIGKAGTFDAACAYQPSVVKEASGLYRMWYRGCLKPGAFGGPSLGTIGYAESNDGVTWVKIPQDGPMGAALAQGPAGRFDSTGLTTPSVFLDGDTWVMYYAGFDSNAQYYAGLARAKR